MHIDLAARCCHTTKAFLCARLAGAGQSRDRAGAAARDGRRGAVTETAGTRREHTLRYLW